MLRVRRTFVFLLFQRTEANGGNFLIIGADGGMPSGHMGISSRPLHAHLPCESSSKQVGVLPLTGRNSPWGRAVLIF